ncbi:hypothetical protein HDU93_002013 [Gonapodya sp. JEL0774]|nr:hypothetical protein HDU93_002013 [Gonapodya sp. JEL0774]
MVSDPPPSLLESLPVEILHSIFRLLPPSTFYASISRLSHRLRTSSRGAIPGCPGDEVAVALSTWLERAPGYADDSPRSYVHNVFFQVGDTLGDLVWAAVSSELHCTPDDCENTLEWTEERIRHEVVHGLMRVNNDNRIGAQIRSVDPRRVKVVVGSLHWQNKLPTPNRLLLHVTNHVQRYRISEVHMGFQDGEDVFGDPAQVSVMDSVTHLFTSTVLYSDDDAGVTELVAASWIVRLLKLYPLARKLNGVMFCPPPGDAMAFVRRSVPLHRRNLVTCLYANRRHAYFSTPLQFDLLRTPILFPNLEELGTFPIALDSQDLTFTRVLPIGLRVPELAPLTRVKKFSLNISIFHVPMDMRGTLTDGTNIVKELTYLFPNLKHLELHLNLSANDLPSLAALFNSLLVEVGSRCAVVIRVRFLVGGFSWKNLSPPEWPSVLDGWFGQSDVIIVGGKWVPVSGT